MLCRTYSNYVINSVFRHPEVEDHVFDDGPRDVVYEISDRYIYLVVYGAGLVPIGLGLFVRKSMIELDCHIAFTPECRGSKAIAGGLLMIDWIKNYTGYRKLTTATPSFNKRCQRFVASLGFGREGINSASYVKNGLVYDQIYYGLEV